MKIPNREICRQLFKKYNTPDNVEEHCWAVSGLAQKLGELYNAAGGNLNLPLISAGALLHDIGKGHDNHSLMGAGWILGEGYPEVAEVVAGHMELCGNSRGKICEESLVYLADKYILGTDVVSLEERFSPKIELFRSNGNTAALKGAMTRFSVSETLETLWISATTGAVVVAAGLSSRMGDFKPLLEIGEETVVTKVVSTFLKAGIKKENLVVVTGNQRERLEKNIKKLGVVTVHNLDYAVTEMFDSAKLGFEAVKGKVAQFFFTPVDVPLFSEKTVRQLAVSGSVVGVPVHKGKSGHPIIIGGGVLELILDYKGGGGLRGAIESIVERKKISVCDEGVLYDMDNKNDYEKIKQKNKVME